MTKQRILDSIAHACDAGLTSQLAISVAVGFRCPEDLALGDRTSELQGLLTEYAAAIHAINAARLRRRLLRSDL